MIIWLIKRHDQRCRLFNTDRRAAPNHLGLSISGQPTKHGSRCRRPSRQSDFRPDRVRSGAPKSCSAASFFPSACIQLTTSCSRTTSAQNTPGNGHGQAAARMFASMGLLWLNAPPHQFSRGEFRDLRSCGMTAGFSTRR